MPTGDNTIELFSHLHIDTGGYFNYEPGPETLDQKGLADGIDLRRARIGVVGNFMDDWHYALVYDFGNTSDSNNPENALANANSSTSPTTSNNFLAGVEDAVIACNRLLSARRAVPVTFDFSVQDVLWTMDEATSSNDTVSWSARPQLGSSPPSSAVATSSTALNVRSNNDRYSVARS